MQPKVSVCIPTSHNRARYLGESLASVLSQEFADIEVVVCDNCSTDDTAAVVAAFGDERIRYHRHDTPISMSEGWLHALESAGGAYGAILGDDDRWEPGFLVAMIPGLDSHPDADVAFSDHWLMDAEGALLKDGADEYSARFGRVHLAEGFYKSFIELAVIRQALWNGVALFRRDRAISLRVLDTHMGKIPDYYLFARLSLGGHGAYYVPQRLASLRVHGGSATTTSQLQMFQDMQRAYAEFLPQVGSPHLEGQLRRKWAEALAHEGVALLRVGQRAAALRAFARSLRIAPLQLRAWAGLGLGVVLLPASLWTRLAGASGLPGQVGGAR